MGEQFTVKVMIESREEAINAAEAVIRFPSAQLEVFKLNKNGSIFSLWAEEPSFENKNGLIRFAGGLPTPGFKRGSGTVLSIVFRAKASGLALIRFEQGAILSDDGLGTNILSELRSARYEIEAMRVPPPSPPPSLPKPVVVDTEPPEAFEIEVSPGTITTERSLKIKFFTMDKLSGMERAELEVDGQLIKKFAGGFVEFTLPELRAGAHQLKVKAFDQAGNIRESAVNVTILSLPPPTIVYGPRIIHTGDYLGLSGIAEPLTKVKLEFKQGVTGDEITVFSDQAGIWHGVFSRTMSQDGPGAVFARLVDASGVPLSGLSLPWTFKVQKIPFIQVGSMIFNQRQFLIILAAFFASVGLMLLFLGKRLRRLFGFLRQETGESLSKIKQELKRMHKDLEEHTASIRRVKAASVSRREAEFHHRLEEEILELKKAMERAEKVIEDYLGEDKTR